MSEPRVVVSGGFDDLGSADMRFLQEASRLGCLAVLVWSDSKLAALTGKPPRFPLAERRYLLQAMRYVSETAVLEGDADINALPAGVAADIWADREQDLNGKRLRHAKARGISYHVLTPQQLAGHPEQYRAPSERKKVIVTGCFDWFHSGHVRFFEEASAYGDLTVCVGSDANIRLLKGAGHPLLPQDERRYMVGSVRHVWQALICSGQGWLDAEPEIQKVKPDFYIVNEDGDKGGKREYCAANRIEFVVLKRTPAPGLPRRSSTDLRGF